MSLAVHVNGPALIYINTPVLQAVSLLGISTDGVNMTQTMYTRDVYTDHYGAHIPFDRIYDGTSAEFNFNLVYYFIRCYTNILPNIFN